ncbi:MAG: PAS domain S-box protein [Myxococcota bacterium]|nr:PAS domain S-box protein [Myxococcota bacterium]
MRARKQDRARKSARLDPVDPEWFRTIGDNPGSLRLLEQMSAVIIELDEAGCIVYVTPNVEAICGYTAEELTGSPGERLVHEDDLWLFDELRRSPDSERGPVRYRTRHKDGHWKWIETAGSTSFIAGDGTGHTVSFARDITQLKEAEEAVRASEDRYRVIVESSEDVVFESDSDGNVIFVTPNIEDVLGYSVEEIHAHEAFQPIHPDDVERLQEEFNIAIMGPKPVRMVYRAMHKDGRVRYLQSTGVAYVHPTGGNHFLNFTRDLTPVIEGLSKQKELESRLQHAQRLESLGVMAGGVAHDFNNLLTPVLADASLALADLPADSPIRFRLERIQRTAQRAAELTRLMLAYAGADEIEVEPLDLSKLVKEMSQLLSAGIGEGTTLTYALASDLPLVGGDPGQLTQVVMNLLTNAVEATGTDGGTVAIRTGTGEQADCYASQFPSDFGPGPYVFLEVEDDGCGMDAETQRRIFDPFFSTKFTGRGLGLASVLGILRAHGGAIEIDSHLGRGTKFRVMLPLAEQGSAGRREDTPQAAEPVPPRSMVLVIDDDDGTREITSDCLERAGLRVLLASDGDTGLKRFEQHADEIAVVILDRTMPGVSGEETFDRIRAIRPSVRILLMSGYAEQRAAEAFAGRQLSGFIGKPFLPEDLLAAVSDLIADVGGAGESPSA